MAPKRKTPRTEDQSESAGSNESSDREEEPERRIIKSQGTSAGASSSAELPTTAAQAASTPQTGGEELPFRPERGRGSLSIPAYIHATGGKFSQKPPPASVAYHHQQKLSTAQRGATGATAYQGAPQTLSWQANMPYWQPPPPQPAYSVAPGQPYSSYFGGQSETAQQSYLTFDDTPGPSGSQYIEPQPYNEQPRTRGPNLSSPHIGRHEDEFDTNTPLNSRHSVADFRIGTVIETVHMAPNGNPDPIGTSDRRYVKSRIVGSIDACFRKAVVIRRYREHMVCLYISSFRGHGMERKSIAMRDDHMRVYDEGAEPEQQEREEGEASEEYLIVRTWQGGPLHGQQEHAQPQPEFITAKGKGKERAQRPGSGAGMHPNSYLSLTRPFPVEYHYAIRVIGELTDSSRDLVLQRYALLDEKGLQEPDSQHAWQESRLAEEFLPGADLRSASKGSLH